MPPHSNRKCTHVHAEPPQIGRNATVGDVTETVLADLDLEPGTRYIVSVRAISALGTSVDRPSDGVTVLLSTSEAKGCCDVTGRGGFGGGLEALLLAGLCVLLTRRRRSRAIP